MPELPEVETIRLSLLPALTGRMVGKIEILNPEVWLGQVPEAGIWRIDGLSRRGKYLMINLKAGAKSAELPEPTAGAGGCLLIHLRMTGQLLLQTEDLPPVRHDHIRLRLDRPATAGQKNQDPVWLVFHDTRRFGRIWWLPDRSYGQPAGLAGLGPEPLEPGFDGAILSARLACRPRTSLKAALLDQTVVAGLGNIYTDEALFDSRLNPARPAGSLSPEEAGRLGRAIIRVLSQAVLCQGTTLRDYVNGWNRKGTFQDCLMVYGRSGQPCRHCGCIVQSRRLSGRTTCWCPSCQPDINPCEVTGHAAP